MILQHKPQAAARRDPDRVAFPWQTAQIRQFCLRFFAILRCGTSFAAFLAQVPWLGLPRLGPVRWSGSDAL